MFYRRQGLPEIDEIVLCQVTKIFPNSVFVDLLEYQQGGMVHISEVSPGRIRNLREFVSIGRQIVCKVLRIDRERGHIDLSLRRVNSNQRQEKLNELKQELKAEQLVKNVAKKLKCPAEQLYRTISGSISKNYSLLYLCFRDVAAGEADLQKMGMEKSLAEELTTAIIDKFKPAKILLQGEITLQTYQPDGIHKIKSALQAIQKLSSSLKMFYLGGGKYKVAVEDADYKSAEKILEKMQALLGTFQDKVSTAAFARSKE